MLRCFDDDNITHVDGSVDPVRDKEIIDYELQLKDLETVEARMAKTQKQAQTGGDKVAKMQYEVLRQYKEALYQGKPARSVQFESVDEQKFARDLFLLTNKPVLYVCNVDDASAVNGNKYVEAVREAPSRTRTPKYSSLPHRPKPILPSSTPGKSVRSSSTKSVLRSRA